ncbi:MAG: DNA topoisomerase IB, partial [Rhizobiales bacterium]|nr:DNA topoisomerase IB [Hyphomicrobiales bacterium]
RLDALAVPPAWNPVFFAVSGRCKVQAMAVDGSGKEQMIYAAWFREKRETDKFDGLWAFGAILPVVRRSAVAALRNPETDAFERSVAACILAIDEGALRVGSRANRQANGTVGAVSLQGKHVDLAETHASLHFTAKGGKERFVRLRQPDLLNHLKARNARGHEDVFAVSTPQGRRKVRPRHVSQWLADHALDPDDASLRLNPFTAKSFRLWHASAAALNIEQQNGGATIKAMSQAAADRLGNTPTVARNSYIHPALFDSELAADRRSTWQVSRAAPFVSRADAALLALLKPEKSRQPKG